MKKTQHSIPNNIEISEQKMKKIKDVIRAGIIKKLSSARQILEFDKEIAAGIYVYSIEELGKLILLENCKKNTNGKYEIKYNDEFISHKKKFEYAFNFLKIKGYPECIYLNKGSFSSDSFISNSFTMDLYSDTKARLGIFYVDLIKSTSQMDDYDVMQIPIVDPTILKNAINGLENVIKYIL